MGFFGKTTEVPETWERYSNPVFVRQVQVQASRPEPRADEWALLRNAVESRRLRFSVSRGVVRIGNAQFPETERGVNDAWAFLGGDAA